MEMDVDAAVMRAQDKTIENSTFDELKIFGNVIHVYLL